MSRHGPPDKFPFFDLPRALRDLVCEFLWAGVSSIECRIANGLRIDHYLDDDVSPSSRKLKALPLWLLTSHDVLTEGTKALHRLDYLGYVVWLEHTGNTIKATDFDRSLPSIHCFPKLEYLELFITVSNLSTLPDSQRPIQNSRRLPANDTKRLEQLFHTPKRLRSLTITIDDWVVESSKPFEISSLSNLLEVAAQHKHLNEIEIHPVFRYSKFEELFGASEEKKYELIGKFEPTSTPK